MRSVLLLVIAVLLCAAAFFPWSQSTLLSENFDRPTPQLSLTTAGAFHTLNGTNVDVVGGSLYGELCSAPESGKDSDNGKADRVLSANASAGSHQRGKNDERRGHQPPAAQSQGRDAARHDFEVVENQR